MTNRLVLRARDAMDRAYAEALDIDALAAIAGCSPAHFIRTVAATFGETPHRYLIGLVHDMGIGAPAGDA